LEASPFRLVRCWKGMSQNFRRGWSASLTKGNYEEVQHGR